MYYSVYMYLYTIHMLNLALISLKTSLKFENSPNISHFSFRPQGVAWLVNETN